MKVKKDKTKQSKKSGKTTTKNKRASFGKSSKNRGMIKSNGGSTKKEKEELHDDYEVQPGDTCYKDYVITMLPKEAFPDPSRVNKGAHSYTLGSKCGNATIEVLLKHGAFFVKKVSEKGTGPCGQVSMKQYGGAQPAWEIAKKRAGFEAK